MNRKHRSFLRSLATVVVGVVFLAATSGHAQAPARVLSLAVMDLEGRQIDVGSLDVLRDALVVELQNSGRLRVMERSQMSKILAEQGFQKSGACDGSECAVEVGKLLAVDRTLLGTVGKLGDSWSLTLRLVSVQTGEVLASVRDTKEGKIDVLLKESVPKLATQISSQFGSDASAHRTASAKLSNYAEAFTIVDRNSFRDDAGLASLKAASVGISPSEAFQLYQRGEISGSWAWLNGMMPYLPLGSMIKQDWRGVGYIYAMLLPVVATASQKNSSGTQLTMALWWGFAIARPIYFASFSNSRLRQGLGMEQSAWVPSPRIDVGTRGELASSLDWRF